jgi:hypothetical protein
MKNYYEFFMRRAIEMAAKGMNSNAGGPFGAMVIKRPKTFFHFIFLRIFYLFPYMMTCYTKSVSSYITLGSWH